MCSIVIQRPATVPMDVSVLCSRVFKKPSLKSINVFLHALFQPKSDGISSLTIISSGRVQFDGIDATITASGSTHGWTEREAGTGCRRKELNGEIKDPSNYIG